MLIHVHVYHGGGPDDESFGVTTTMLLPGGVELLLYQPKHASPLDL